MATNPEVLSALLALESGEPFVHPALFNAPASDENTRAVHSVPDEFRGRKEDQLVAFSLVRKSRRKGFRGEEGGESQVNLLLLFARAEGTAAQIKSTV